MPRVRYVGLPSPMFADPEKTRALIRAGKLTEAQVWQAEGMRNGAARPDGKGHYPVTVLQPGISVFRLVPPLVSRAYEFGPVDYELDMTEDDWRRVQTAHYEIEVVTAQGIVKKPMPYAPMFRREG